jgi:hypothetical protein
VGDRLLPATTLGTGSLTNLVGHYFNYLCPNHVAADCRNLARCLRCHREGHQARACKRPRSPDPSGPPPL